MENSNDLKIVLFANKNKKKETHPDFNGQIEKDGKKFKVVLWKTTSKDKKTNYLSGKVDLTTPIEEKKKEVEVDSFDL
jgi:hypothetical protein